MFGQKKKISNLANQTRTEQTICQFANIFNLNQKTN